MEIIRTAADGSRSPSCCFFSAALRIIRYSFVEMFVDRGYPEKPIHDALDASFWLMPATPVFIVDGEIPYITSKNIKNREIDFKNAKRISYETYQSISSNRPVKVGDVLISMIGTLGQTAVIQDERPFYGQNLYLLRLDKSIVDTVYFCEFFNSEQAQHTLQRKSNKSTQAYLKANHIEDLVLPIAPMEMQKEFASFVTQINITKLTLHQGLDKLELLKQSLMQKYFG